MPVDYGFNTPSCTNYQYLVGCRQRVEAARNQNTHHLKLASFFHAIEPNLTLDGLRIIGELVNGKK